MLGDSDAGSHLHPILPLLLPTIPLLLSVSPVGSRLWLCGYIYYLCFWGLGCSFPFRTEWSWVVPLSAVIQWIAILFPATQSRTPETCVISWNRGWEGIRQTWHCAWPKSLHYLIQNPNSCLVLPESWEAFLSLSYKA